MPPQETSHRFQTVTYWAKGGTDAYAQPTLSTPVELLARWEFRRAEALDAQGRTVALDAFAVLDRAVAVGGLMWLGEYEDWLGTGSAGDDDELMEVVTYDEIPDVKGRFYERTAGLRKFRDTLPSVS